MPHACVNAAAVRIEATNDHIVEADERGQHAHGGDQPERRITGNGERETDHIGFARAPIAVPNRRRAFPIDVARPLNVSWYHYVGPTRLVGAANLLAAVAVANPVNLRSRATQIESDSRFPA